MLLRAPSEGARKNPFNDNFRQKCQEHIACYVPMYFNLQNSQCLYKEVNKVLHKTITNSSLLYY